jgi:hypothetical protein
MPCKRSHSSRITAWLVTLEQGRPTCNRLVVTDSLYSHFAHALLNLFDGDFFLLRVDQILEHLLRSGKVNVRAGERSVSHQADERAFQLADVGLNGAGAANRPAIAA